MKKQEELYSFPQQNDGAVVETDIRMIPLSELHDFNGHPFKVENDMALFVEYTDAVSSASIGASTLATGLTTLYTNTDTLNTAVGDLHIAVGTLKDGTGELKSGTEEFVSETDGMDTQVSDEIDNITTSMTGEDVETVSFVSKQNTNIKSVQFVIQTEGIEIETIEEVETPEPEKLNFWQKLLKLFGWD